MPHCMLFWSIGKYKNTYQSTRNNNIKDFSIHQNRFEKITLSNPKVHYLFASAHFILHFQSRCVFPIQRRGVSVPLGDRILYIFIQLIFLGLVHHKMTKQRLKCLAKSVLKFWNINENLSATCLCVFFCNPTEFRFPSLKVKMFLFCSQFHCLRTGVRAVQILRCLPSTWV